MGQDYAFNYVLDHNLKTSIQMPYFEIDNENVSPIQEFIFKKEKSLNKDIKELIYSSLLTNNMNIDLVIRVSEKSPIIRFRYVIYSNKSK